MIANSCIYSVYYGVLKQIQCYILVVSDMNIDHCPGIHVDVFEWPIPRTIIGGLSLLSLRNIVGDRVT